MGWRGGVGGEKRGMRSYVWGQIKRPQGCDERGLAGGPLDQSET